MALFIGVDGGGTRTRAVLVDESLRVLGRGEDASSNAYSVGRETALKNVLSVTQQALDAASAENAAISGWGLGLAGAVSDLEQTDWRDALSPFAQDMMNGATNVVVDEDVAAAQAGAFNGEAGVVCIAGTGANAWGRDENGKRARADGWGPLLGDRGSGYAIGEAALRETCLALDTNRDSPLAHRVLEQLNVSAEELIAHVYAPDFGKDRVASLVPAVIAAWRENDVSAATILHDAALALCLTTCAVVWKLEATRVAPCGGVLSRGSYVRDLFAASLRYRVPGLEVVEPCHDAAVGAALLAMQRAS